MVSQIKVNEIIKQSGSSITLGESGDTISIPSGATLNSAGTNTLSGIDNGPAWHAFLSANQNCSNATETVILFDHEALDTNSAYDPSTGRFTVPSGGAGKYLIYAQLVRNNFTNSRYLSRIRVNGSHASQSEQRNTDTGGTTYQTVNITSIQTLAEGDYVDVTLYQDSGGSAGAYGTNTTNGKSIFLGHRLLGI
tara:strand:+ start:530 stop:1111 length:582 start_codon:yes stop_codon:yes gene_type:complete